MDDKKGKETEKEKNDADFFDINELVQRTTCCSMTVKQKLVVDFRGRR